MNFQGQYSLSTKGESNKSLIFVKLTDSALQSIETYLSSKEDSSVKPTIQFQENSGVISLPVNDGQQNYGFTLSNMDTNGLQSSFQCLQHINHRSLKSLGVMLKKMHIHAKEDSYEKTRVKMAAADKEQKSLCTKELKSNHGKLVGGKFKIKHPEVILPPGRFHPASQKESSKNNIKKKLANSSTVVQEPIRKRIIHILAIKAYKKPELLLRLMKEGITDKDKKDFDNILCSVGSLKGSIYNLASHLWNEVEENWGFCTKEELELIQRRRQQFLKHNRENEFPDSDTQSNSIIQKSVPLEPIAEITPLKKKQRISHYSSKNTDQVAKNNSSGSSISKISSHLSNKVEEKAQDCTKKKSQLTQRRRNRSRKRNKKNGVPGSETQNNSVIQKGLPSEPVTQVEPLNKKQRISHCSSESTDQVSKVYSSGYSNFNIESNLCKVEKKMQFSAKEDLQLLQRRCQEFIKRNRENEVPDSQTQNNSVIQNGLPSESIAEKEPFSKNQVSQYNPKSTAQIAKSNSPEHSSSIIVSSLCNDGKEKKQVCTKEQLQLLQKFSFFLVPDSDTQNISVQEDASSEPVSENEQLNKERICHYSSKSTGEVEINNSSGSSCSSKVSLPVVNNYCSDEENPPMADSTYQLENSDYIQTYTAIESEEQRSKYAKDFDAVYDEYLKLHTEMKAVSLKLLQLEKCLKECKFGSTEFKEILAKMQRLRSFLLTNEYRHAWNKFNTLEKKLSHIRMLVQEYDSSQNAEY